MDFDFFATRAFQPEALLAALPFLAHATILQQSANTLTCRVERGAPVKVSFFGLPRWRCLEPPHVAPDNGLQIASLVDLAGTKAAVVQQRAEVKDYLDLDAMMNAGIGLALALAAAAGIYGPGFNPQLTLKALCYFGDGDLNQLPNDAQQRLVQAVAQTDLSRLPPIALGGKP